MAHPALGEGLYNEKSNQHKTMKEQSMILFRTSNTFTMKIHQIN